MNEIFERKWKKFLSEDMSSFRAKDISGIPPIIPPKEINRKRPDGTPPLKKYLMLEYKCSFKGNAIFFENQECGEYTYISEEDVEVADFGFGGVIRRQKETDFFNYADEGAEEEGWVPEEPEFFPNYQLVSENIFYEAFEHALK